MAMHGVRRERFARRTNRLAKRPTLEGLEVRTLLYATLGPGWAYSSRITYSFAPDGTSVGGVASNLNAALAARGIGTSAWKDAFRRAAAAWQAVANVNLAEVPDDGSPYGVAGNQQGDPRFGDIRVAGIPQAPGGLAMSFLPPPANGGSLAGDLVVNTSQAWKVNSDYDLQTVALHEIGHALGMGHTATAAAAMYASYTGIKQALHTDDVAGLRSLFGARQPDAFDAAASNGAYTTATDITPYLDADAQVRLGGLDITGSSDTDWFVVVVPANSSGTLTVAMQASGLSSLSPKVTVYNAAMQAVAAASMPDSYGGTATTAAIAGVVPGRKYYIRAQAASAGGTGTGAYGLLVNLGSAAMAPVDPPTTAKASEPDQGGGSLAEVLRRGKRRDAGGERAEGASHPSGPPSAPHAGHARRAWHRPVGPTGGIAVAPRPRVPDVRRRAF